MTEWDDFGKDAEITISFNELMNILKVYDETRVKNIFPCQRHLNLDECSHC